jgi:hypothetical protein
MIKHEHVSFIMNRLSVIRCDKDVKNFIYHYIHNDPNYNVLRLLTTLDRVGVSEKNSCWIDYEKSLLIVGRSEIDIKNELTQYRRQLKLIELGI